MKNSTIKEIKVDGVKESPDGKRIEILSGKDKYSFFKTDYNNPTADSEAYGQYKAAKVGLGDSVQVDVAEVPKTFVNNEGKTINYTQRTIYRFLHTDPVGVEEDDAAAPF